MPSRLTDLPLQPQVTRVTRGSFGDNLPTPVLEMGRMLIDNPYSALTEVERRRVEEVMRQKFAFVHVPNRYQFQGRFHVKQAHPPEVKQCRETDRLWLLGLGMPGREEMTLVEDVYPYYDARVGRYVEEIVPVTASTFPDDTVLVFTEVSWEEYRQASSIVDSFSGYVKAGLCKHYQLPAHYMLGLVLATPGYDTDTYVHVAHQAHIQAGPGGIDPSILG